MSGMRKSCGKILIAVSAKYFLRRSSLLALLLSTAAVAAVPASNHVFVLVEENHSYESVIGNSAMPYFNSLAQQYGLAAGAPYAPAADTRSPLCFPGASATMATPIMTNIPTPINSWRSTMCRYACVPITAA